MNRWKFLFFRSGNSLGLALPRAGAGGEDVNSGGSTLRSDTEARRSCRDLLWGNMQVKKQHGFYWILSVFFTDYVSSFVPTLYHDTIVLILFDQIVSLGGITIPWLTESRKHWHFQVLHLLQICRSPSILMISWLKLILTSWEPATPKT